MAKEKAEEKTESKANGQDQIELARKISAKTVCGKLKAPEKATPLFHLMGVATGFKTGMSNYGEFVEFSGQFEALNVLEGNENFGVKFISSKCFMPEPVESQLRGLLEASAKENQGEIKPVSFVFTVGYKPATGEKPSQTGYEYTVRSIVQPKGADLLQDLRGKVPQLQHASAE